MKNFRILNLFLIIFVSSFLIIRINAEGGDKKNKNILKPYGEPSITKLNINNISTFIFNDGQTDQNPNGNSGFEYPKGSNKQAVFESGFLWGGKVDGQIRTGGSAYRSGMKPGKILNNGFPANLLQAENPDNPNVRIYRVRRNYKIADLSMEAIDEKKSKDEVEAQYKKDWNEWLAENGAPFEDVNKDGNYDPDIDIPGVPGTDQTIWFVTNDIDSNQTKYLYGALPMGIEMQATYWAYNAPAPLGSMFFRKYKIINKSDKDFTDMYFGMWADPDNGDASDDFVGCDTLLNLGFAYNAKSNDALYGDIPPATGFKLLQGPVINGSLTDTAFVNGRKIEGKKNLKMTAFSFFIGGDPVYSDPPQAEYFGTLEFYNLLQGKISTTGEFFTDPVTSSSTTFALSGDPIKKTGWIDGILHAPGDRRLMVSSGPFTMAPGDTQDVVYAEIAAGAFDHISNLAAVSLLKFYSSYAQSFYENSLEPPRSISPKVDVSELHGQIVLTWGNNQDQINNFENYKSGSYKFQGYNIYQFPVNDSLLEDAVKIATFDVKDGVTTIIEKYPDPSSGLFLTRLAQKGTDSGIKRFINIKQDYIGNKSWLNDGAKYYFAVTAYYYSSDINSWPRSFETKPKIMEAIPQTSNPGVRFDGKFDEQIEVFHSKGMSDGKVEAYVVDPKLLNGDNYKITFDSLNGKLIWNIKDVTTSSVLLSNQNNFDKTIENPFVNGIRIIVDSGKISITLNKNNFNADDEYTFKSPGITSDLNTAKADVKEINVFPNPYYGANPAETNKYQRFVTFNHLPRRAKVRIFNLAGQLVRTLDKNSTSQFLQWDLLNEHRFQAPSGVFIAYIEMPDLGVTKILKFVIVQEQIVPDHF